MTICHRESARRMQGVCLVRKELRINSGTRVHCAIVVGMTNDPITKQANPENRTLTLVSDYQISLPFFSSNGATIDNEQQINMSSPVAACNVCPDESVNSGSVTHARTVTKLTSLPVVLTKQEGRQKH